MDLNDTPELSAYRARVRDWLEEHRDEAPEVEGDDISEAVLPLRRAWQRRLAEGGLVGVTWPEEHGGRGRGPLEQVAVNQEIDRAGVPGILDHIGIGILGPVVIAHGSEEQKARHLGPLLHADEVWCQLFSEPAAGSDLAAVQTRAKAADGGYRLTGQKVWTTNAQFASFGLILARTDPDVPKHHGLTMFIVPMDAEGVSVQPLRQISGEAHFNEVFFDDVWVDASAAVGPVGGGWRTALTTLMFERLAIGSGAGFGFDVKRFARAIADTPGAAADPVTRRRLGEVGTELLALRYNGFRLLTQFERGQIPGPEAGLSKVTGVNAAIAGGDLIVDALGPDALESGEWAELTSFLPGLRSAGGSDEILRNTVGERVLGLPPEPRLDKDLPFTELRAREREAA